MFSICMTHYQETWKQMRAARFDDLKKVTNVIRHQVIDENMFVIHFLDRKDLTLITPHKIVLIQSLSS